jgi:septal ring factor EnvC (AmiA/AmiB activator)
VKHLPLEFKEAACHDPSGRAVGSSADSLGDVTCPECCRMIQKRPQLFAELLAHARARGAVASAIEFSELVEHRSTEEYEKTLRELEAARDERDDLRDDLDRAEQRVEKARLKMRALDAPKCKETR